MSVLRPQERRVADAIGALTRANPFHPDRVTLEKTVLQKHYVGAETVWSFDPSRDKPPANVAAIDRRADELGQRLRTHAQQTALDPDDAQRYVDIVLYLAFSRVEDPFYRAITEDAPIDFFDTWSSAVRRDLDVPGVAPKTTTELAHLFALFFQMRRAFHFTYRRILGGSQPAASLRSQVWQSIFTHDLDRYRHALFDRMQHIPTLITGPSGTGKELVASAIGWSRYIPYDPEKGGFSDDFKDSFRPLNLSALSPTLIESELFGHARGAFTGAVQEREGYLESSSSAVTIFLDEIGEVDPSTQVKLLRVLETRNFRRLGDAEPRRAEGKIIAATHRDLRAEMEAGRFREDFYYRLCADRIQTPALAAQIAEDPRELERIVVAVAHRVGGPDMAGDLAADTMQAIDEGVGRDYSWPGNMRELEQCVRNVLIRRRYLPAGPIRENRAARMFDELAQGHLTAEEVLERYCTLVYVQSGSYEEAARRLLLDRRTVKRRVAAHWVQHLTAEETS